MSFSFRGLHFFDNKEGANVRARSHSEVLERTKLSRLSSLSQRESFALPINKSTICAVCQKSLKNEAEFCLAIQVCRPCLKIHAAVEIQLNTAAEKKSLEMKRATFLGKLEAQK